MADVIQTSEFLSLSARHPVVDVRSPSEFSQGHVPGAYNIPLFNDRERKEVGTAYKQVNREAAMYLGLDFAGKKLVKLGKKGEKVAGKERVLLLHCWRGGMRSKSMAWLFETLGIDCYLLEGGYKSYRRYIHELMALPFKLIVIGGRTGSGKTDILHHMGTEGFQVIDLEGLAHHKGSAFGALGEQEQPTNEQFENDLGEVIRGIDTGREVWIEDESRNVGKCVIPGIFYNRMRESELLFLDIPLEVRAMHLVRHYASHPPEALQQCVLKIEKKLGGDRTREAIESIRSGDFLKTAQITLQYYDKAYMFSLQKNHAHYRVIPSGKMDPGVNAGLLMGAYEE